MKKANSLRFICALALLVIAFACRKTVAPLAPPQAPVQTDSTQKPRQKPDSQAVQSLPFPQNPVTGCSYAPNYGDSIIYPQPTTQGKDYIVSPVNNPGSGTYLSWPQGLVINDSTGAVDVTQSQTGERFMIGFVQSGTSDTCLTSLILGGASYEDSVYVIANGQTQAWPYFNANPYMPSPCGTAGSCAFDVTGSAAAMKVVVDPNSGMIDLLKTLNGPGGLLSSGAFGLLPLSGQEISPVIYYQLNDGSNNALQNIQVNIVYYSSKSSITPSLLNNLVNKLGNILGNLLIQNTGNPRPPMVIITRYN
jgi:hypothetical protein